MAIILAGYIMERLLHITHDLAPLSKKLDSLWFYVQPFLYGTIGAELNFLKIDGNIVWKAILITVISVASRFISTFLITFVKREHALTLKEKVFIGICWCPKGSV